MSVHYYPLVNKIMGTLNIRDRLFQLNSDLDSSEAFSVPFITIAREPGSGGAPIARAVAQKLSFTLIDEQIIEDIAQSTKQRKAIIQAIDEKSRSKIEDIVHSLLNSEYVNDVTYVTELARVILAYALKGKVVILGRGANFITPFAKGLHINITAPYAVRVQRARDYEGHNEVEAKAVIAKFEKERKEFIKQYFKKDISKCNSYDMTINTTYFPIDQASDIIVEAFYRKFSRMARYAGFFMKNLGAVSMDRKLQ
jgi:cytidylate kinase